VKNQEQEHKLRTKHSKSANPDFGGELLQFPGISTVEALSFVRWVYFLIYLDIATCCELFPGVPYAHASIETNAATRMDLTPPPPGGI
jgi:hypothetical protein